ncbi:MAG TPA: hypothetical protein VHN14_32825 [Kofleriaceae bacterium]|jgi:hypothetical protein|nr:hypothetical protein [Kofleriaceae bacterium]
MKLPSPAHLLRLSAVLTLIGLLLMLWSMFVPTPLPVILAMSVGQLFGTLAFALYGFVVLQDLRITRRARRIQHAPDLPDMRDLPNLRDLRPDEPPDEVSP